MVFIGAKNPLVTFKGCPECEEEEVAEESENKVEEQYGINSRNFVECISEKEARHLCGGGVKVLYYIGYSGRSDIVLHMKLVNS